MKRLLLLFVIGMMAAVSVPTVQAQPGLHPIFGGSFRSRNFVLQSDTLFESNFKYVPSLSSRSWIDYTRLRYGGDWFLSDSLFYSWARSHLFLNYMPLNEYDQAGDAQFLTNVGAFASPGVSFFGGDQYPYSITERGHKLLAYGYYGDGGGGIESLGNNRIEYFAIFHGFKGWSGFRPTGADTSCVLNADLTAFHPTGNISKSIAINSFAGGGIVTASHGDRTRNAMIINEGQAGGQFTMAMNGANAGSGTGIFAVSAAHGGGLAYDYGALGTGNLIVNASGVIALGSGEVGDAIDDYAAGTVANKYGYNISIGHDYVNYRGMTLNFGSGNNGGAPYAVTLGNGAYANMPGEFSFMNALLKQIDNGHAAARVNKDAWLYLHGETAASTTDTINIMGQENARRYIEGYDKNWTDWTRTSTLVTAYVVGKTERGIKTAAFQFQFVVRSVDHVSLTDSNMIVGLEKKILYSNGDMDVNPSVKTTSSPMLYWLATGDSSGTTKWMIKQEYQTIYW